MDAKNITTKESFKLKFFITAICFFITSQSHSVLAQNLTNSGVIKFAGDNNILELKYSNNRKNLLMIEKEVEKHLVSINEGSYHIAIISYIPDNKTNDLTFINNASIKGSVVRAHFKLKYKLSNYNFTFYIDNSTSSYNTIRVEVKKGSPALYNNEIYYTTSNNSTAVKAAIDKYVNIPFFEDNNDLSEDSEYNRKVIKRDNPGFMILIPSMKLYSGIIQKKSMIPLPGTKKIEYNNKKHESNRTLINENDLISENSSYSKLSNLEKPKTKIQNSNYNTRYYQPLFGIKSNLVYWYGVTPNLKQSSFIPNAEIEIFYSERLSTSLEGYYTPFDKIETDAQEWFKESGLVAEQKIWFAKNKHFNRLYIGIVGLYGDYDNRDLEKSEFGYTGTYFGAGISAGFLIPLFRGICFEVGVRGVYKLDNWESYKVRNGGFYLEESGRNSGLDLCGVKFSFQYRFGKLKKISL